MDGSWIRSEGASYLFHKGLDRLGGFEYERLLRSLESGKLAGQQGGRHEVPGALSQPLREQGLIRSEKDETNVGDAFRQGPAKVAPEGRAGQHSACVLPIESKEQSFQVRQPWLSIAIVERSS